MCGLCPSGWMLYVYAQCTSYMILSFACYCCCCCCRCRLQFFFSCSIFLSRCLPLSVVLNAFTNHIHSHISKAKIYNSACAENVEAISVLSGCVFFLLQNYFLSHFPLYVAIFLSYSFFSEGCYLTFVAAAAPRRSHRRCRRQFYLYQSQIFIVFVCIVTSFGFLSCHTSQRDKEKGLVAIATAVNVVNTLSIAIHLRDGQIFPNTASTGVILSIGLCVN